jgi:hypothetical protein
MWDIAVAEVGYCKPTFIRERENFARFARTSPSRIFLVANLLAANQFIIEKSRNKVAANKSWFTVIARNDLIGCL